MLIGQVIQSIGQQLATRPNITISEEHPLLAQIEAIGGFRPMADRVELVLEKLRQGNYEPAQLPRDLLLTSCLTESHQIEQVLNAINGWLISNQASSDGQGDTSATALNAASTASLVAATSTTNIISDKIINIIPHARKMLAHSNITVPKDNAECWELWLQERDKWKLTGHKFSTQLQPDFFNTSPHVKNIFSFEHPNNTVPVTMGPDDAKGIFDNRAKEIDEAEIGKVKERKSYQKKVEAIIKLSSLFGTEKDTVVQALNSLKDFEKIGDAEFSTINDFYGELEKRWDAQCSAVHNLNDFLKALENIKNLMKSISEGGHSLTKIDPVKKQLELAIGSFHAGNIPSGSDIELIVSKFRELMEFQKTLSVQDGYIAVGKRVQENEELVFARPRGQAGLLILDVVRDLMTQAGKTPKDLKVIDFCGSGVLYTIAKKLSESERPQIIDLERKQDAPLFAANPNPNKILVDLSQMIGVAGTVNSPLILQQENASAEAPDAMVLNFVLNHCEPGEIKEAILAAKKLSSKNTLLAISIPENYSLSGSSNLLNILQVLGYRQVTQIHGANELHSQTRSQINKTRRNHTGSLVASTVKKPFKVFVFRNEEDQNVEIVAGMKEDSFSLNKTPTNGRPASGNGGEEDENNLINLRGQQKLDAITHLTPGDLVIVDHRIVTSKELTHNPAYKEFEERLSVLRRFIPCLDTQDAILVNEIERLWYRDFASSLTKSQVDFVMKTPDQIQIGTDTLAQLNQEMSGSGLSDGNLHFIPALADGERIPIWKAYTLDCEHKRAATQKTPYELTVPTLDKRIKELLQMRFQSITFQLQQIKNFSRSNFQSEVRTSFTPLLRSICLGGETIVAKGNPPNLFNVSRSAGLQGTFDHNFIIAPSFVIHPSDLSDRISPDSSFLERVKIHQANANLTDQGLIFFVDKQLNVINKTTIDNRAMASNIVLAVKNGTRKLSKDEIALLAQSLQVRVEDLVPPSGA